MQYHEFVGQVHHRAKMATTEQAVAAIRATLETLAERLTKDEADDLAAQLPQEIGIHLETATDEPEDYSLDDFFKMVAVRENSELPDATYHARVVVEVLQEAVTPAEMAHVRSQLPSEYSPLFDAGSQGQMDTN